MAGEKGRVLIDYTNHAGIRKIRQIDPVGIYLGSTDWHPKEQWLLDAYDVARDDARTFAIADIHHWWPDGPPPDTTIDASLAKQLQRSMERNARMGARLQKLQTTFADPTTETVQQIAAILKDEEPSWPEA